MNNIHFVHTSDWHLGFIQYNKIQRFDDFRQAAEKTIDKIIELRPQFVLHTGDIFHRATPKPATIRQAVKLLLKLRRAEIPFYIIRGNHDGNVSKYLKRGGGIISLLNDLDLLEYIDDEVLDITDQISILGVGYYPGKQVSDYIDRLLEENTDFLHSDRFKIIAIHAYVEGQIENHSQISLKKVKDLGVHYLGAGHYHIPWNDEERGVFAPGSVETTKITDANRMDVENSVSMFSSFYEIKSEFNEQGWQKLDIQTHRITVRPKILLAYISEKESIEEVREELDSKLENARSHITATDMMLSMEAPILSVRISTQLELEELNKLQLEEWYEDQYLHIITHIDGKSNSPQLNSDLGTSIIREDAILELIEREGLNPETHANMIMEILNHFGDHSKSRALNEDTVDNLTSLLLEEIETLTQQKEENAVDDEDAQSKVEIRKEKSNEKIDETVKQESENLTKSDDGKSAEDEIMSIIGLDAFMEEDE